MDREFTFKALVASVATYLTMVFGEADRAMGVLVTLMVLDYISGVLAAWYGKRLDSKVGLKGIVKKVLMLLLMAVAHQVDVLTGTQGVVRNAVIWFLAANEGLSILENAGECGLTIPILSNALALLKQKAEQQGGGSRE